MSAVLLIVIPLLAAFLSILSKKLAPYIMIVVSFSLVILLAYVPQEIVTIGGFAAPYGITLVLDTYSAFALYFSKYLEAYNRALTSRDAEKYVDGEDEVVDFETLINEVALLRNRWLGIMKALESKNFMLGHIVRLRAAGMEDITIG